MIHITVIGPYCGNKPISLSRFCFLLALSSQVEVFSFSVCQASLSLQEKSEKGPCCETDQISLGIFFPRIKIERYGLPFQWDTLVHTHDSIMRFMTTAETFVFRWAFMGSWGGLTLQAYFFFQWKRAVTLILVRDVACFCNFGVIFKNSLCLL